MRSFVEEREKYTVLRIEGRVDASAAPVLENKVDALLAKGNRHLVIDFSRVTYLSSAGLRFLLAFTKRYKLALGSFVLIGVNEEVMEIIKMAGFDQILQIFSNEEVVSQAWIDS